MAQAYLLTRHTLKTVSTDHQKFEKICEILDALEADNLAAILLKLTPTESGISAPASFCLLSTLDENLLDVIKIVVCIESRAICLLQS